MAMTHETQTQETTDYRAHGAKRQRRQPTYARDTDGALVVSVSDAAVHYRVSRRTIYNWIAAGKIDCRRQPGGLRRVVVTQMAAEPREAK